METFPPRTRNTLVVVLMVVVIAMPSSRRSRDGPRKCGAEKKDKSERLTVLFPDCHTAI